MAQPALQKFKRRAVAVKLQAAEGTPEAPNTSTDGVLLYDGSSGVEHDTDTSNRDRPFFGGNEIATYNHRAFIQGGFRIYAPAVPGDANDGTPDCHVLLAPAGLTRVLDELGGTTRYNPVSAGVPVATAYWWHAGTHKQVYDARNAITALTMQIGQRYGGQVRIQGGYDSVLEDALPSVTVPDTMGPIVQAHNSVTMIGEVGETAINAWGKQLTIEMGNALATKEYTEHKVNSIDDRAPTYTLRIARTAKADFDPWALMRAGTFIEASMRVLNAEDLYTEQGIRGQIESVNEVDIDGDYGWEISGPCVPSSDGGDELYIEFGDASA